MPLPEQYKYLDNHLELATNDDASDAVHDDIFTMISNDPETQIRSTDATSRAKEEADYIYLYRYGNQYYKELPVKLDLIQPLPDTDRKNALQAGLDLLKTKGTATFNKNKLYAWKISKDTYNKLRTNKLTTTGIIKEISDKYFDYIYNRNNRANFVENVNLFHSKRPGHNRYYLQDEIELDILRKKENFQTEWNRTAKTIGLMDGLWVFLGALVALIPEEDIKYGWNGYLIDSAQFTFNQAFAVMAANVIFPITLGIGAALTNYYAQVDAFREKYGDEPSKDVKDEIWRQSKQLGYKVMFAVGGWTIGYEIVAPMFFALDPTGGSQSVVILSAFIIGLTAATFLCVAAMHFMARDAQKAAKDRGIEMSYGSALWHVLQNNKLDLVKLFVIGTIAGAAWHMINTLLPTAWMDGFTDTGASILEYFLKGTSTYIAVTGIFMMLKPKDSIEERKNSGWFNAYSPVAYVDKADALDKLVDRELKAVKRLTSTTMNSLNSH